MRPDEKHTEADGPAIECASPPCLLHEVDPAYSGLGGDSAGGKAQTPRQHSPEPPGEEATTQAGHQSEQGGERQGDNGAPPPRSSSGVEQNP